MNPKNGTVVFKSIPNFHAASLILANAPAQSPFFIESKTLANVSFQTPKRLGKPCYYSTDYIFKTAASYFDMLKLPG